MTGLDAALRLHTAIQALTQPTQQPLDRSPSATRHARTQLDTAHRDHIRYLGHRHAIARTRRDAAGARRAIDAMTRAGQAHRDRRAALAALHASTPSLLEQLHDAVHSTNGAGNGSRGVHRSPLNTAAAELLAAIRRAVADRDGPLDAALHAWQPTDPDQAADHAQRWVIDARDIVEPSRRLEARGACPRCGNRHIWTTEGDERIRRAAIQIHVTGDQARDYAACINPSCDGRWPRTHWDLLAAALRTDPEAG